MQYLREDSAQWKARVRSAVRHTSQPVFQREGDPLLEAKLFCLFFVVFLSATALFWMLLR